MYTSIMHDYRKRCTNSDWITTDFAIISADIRGWGEKGNFECLNEILQQNMQINLNEKYFKIISYYNNTRLYKKLCNILITCILYT